jgi:hypothetical protein
MDNELWRVIENTQGLYEVSTLGRVRRLPRRGKTGEPKIIGSSPSLRGYLRVDLWVGGRRDRRALADVVGAAFLPKPGPDQHYALRDDDSRADYSVANVVLKGRPPNTGYLLAMKRLAAREAVRQQHREAMEAEREKALGEYDY